MILINCRVSSTRTGVPVYTGRDVQIDTVPLHKAPSLPDTDDLKEIGELNVATLYDTTLAPGGNWLPGDRVTVLSKTGVSRQRVGTSYGVYSNAEMGGRLAHMTALLVSIPTFSQVVTVSRRDFSDMTHQSSGPEPVGTITCYLRDMSSDFRVPGVAPEFILKLVTDGTSDVQQGDHLTDVPLATAPRTPILQVQHVALHVLAGWSYKTALVTVVQ